MTTGLEGHCSAPSRRRTRRLDNRRGEGATPRDGAATVRDAGDGAHPGVHMSGRPDAAQGGEVLAALDLGTNNCRLLVARPDGPGFRVIDAFSRIVRLGQGLSRSGRLTEDAIERTIEALAVCVAKMDRRRVTRFRAVATEACRRAGNGGEFLSRVVERTGLALEVITTEEEAALALAGCRPLFDPEVPCALVFDIGGGSTEIAWQRAGPDGPIVAAVSMPIGVVTLAERHGGDRFTAETYETMIADVGGRLQAFEGEHGIAASAAAGQVQLLGTSGTVTTLAGVQLALTRYKRDRVDGVFLDVPETLAIGRRLAGMGFDERAAHPCIGRERADLVVAGCAILEAICRTWPVPRLRVADRGVREGILFGLMTQRS